MLNLDFWKIITLHGTKGGIQPPGSGSRPARLHEALHGELAHLTFAGAKALQAARPRPPMYDEQTPQIAELPLVADVLSLDNGPDWLRVQLTAMELLSSLRLTRREEDVVDSDEVRRILEVRHGANLVVRLDRPLRAEIKAAVSDLLAEIPQALERRERILSEANDAGLFFALGLQLQEFPSRHLLQMFDVLELVLAWPLYETKHYFAVPRPSEVNDSVTSFIPAPRHASLPSAHASYGVALATLLCACLAFEGSRKTWMHEVATDIALHRQYAGLHTRLDSLAGAELGTKLAEWLLSCATDPTRWPKWSTLFAQARNDWRTAGLPIVG